jgi:hypothetical protein
MMLLRDEFARGMTLAQFLESAQANKDLWIAASRRADAPAELVARLQPLPARNLLVLAEDWCGDALGTVPPLARLAAEVPQLELRILARDQNLEVMDAHLTRGARAIPVVIVLDQDFRELAWWGSRPAPLQRWVLLPETQKLSKEDRYREIRRWYSSDRGRTALAEITRLLERTAVIEDVA